MLKAGGLLDQPLLWFHAQRAGYLNQFLDKVADPEFKIVNLKGEEAELYIEVLAIRDRQRRNARY